MEKIRRYRRTLPLKKLYQAVDRFCARHPRFGIHNLMLYVVIGTAIVYAISQMTGKRNGV